MRILVAIIALLSAALFSTVAYAQQDIDPPVLVSVTFEPSRVDTSRSAQTITVTAIITDDLSGFSHGWIHYRHPDTTQHHSVYLTDASHTQDGRYVGTFTLPRFSAYGAWSMTSVELHDLVGNLDLLARPNEPEQIGTEVWPARFETFTFENAPSGPSQNHLLYIPVAIAP